MNEQELNAEAQKAELEKLENVKAAISILDKKESKFMFVIPEAQHPAASVYEIYYHASVVKKMGFKTLIFIEKNDYVPPTWIEKELVEHEHINITNPKLNVGPQDFLVIPEVFSNVMEQTKHLPCHRIALLQSVDYMVNSLIPGTDWSSFGIEDIITTSLTLKEWVESFYGKKYKFHTYDLGIPEYFKKSKIPQRPVVSIIGRNPNEIAKLIKLFFAKYPQYSWISFDPMVTESKPPQPMRRKDFAKRLATNFAAVWVDRISSLGTFPLECMKTGTVPICLKPDIMPEYLLKRDENGVAVDTVEGGGLWTENFYDLPVMIVDMLVKFLDDNINPEIYESMDNISAKYSHENSEKQLTTIYQNLINKRVEILNAALEIGKGVEMNVNSVNDNVTSIDLTQPPV